MSFPDCACRLDGARRPRVLPLPLLETSGPFGHSSESLVCIITYNHPAYLLFGPSPRIASLEGKRRDQKKPHGAEVPLFFSSILSIIVHYMYIYGGLGGGWGGGRGTGRIPVFPPMTIYLFLRRKSKKKKLKK